MAKDQKVEHGGYASDELEYMGKESAPQVKPAEEKVVEAPKEDKKK